VKFSPGLLNHPFITRCVVQGLLEIKNTHRPRVLT
jgi:hypothetical protein